jgi:hypothetical protein
VLVQAPIGTGKRDRKRLVLPSPHVPLPCVATPQLRPHDAGQFINEAAAQYNGQMHKATVA